MERGSKYRMLPGKDPEAEGLRRRWPGFEGPCERQRREERKRDEPGSKMLDCHVRCTASLAAQKAKVCLEGRMERIKPPFSPIHDPDDTPTTPLQCAIPACGVRPAFSFA